MRIVKIFPALGMLLSLQVLHSCHKGPAYYAAADFENVPKIDVHFHYLTLDERYMKFAISQNFRLLSPNWDWENTIDQQFAISCSVHNAFPGEYAFFGTFSSDSFNYPGFADKTIARIRQCMQAGASGIKIWKNIGMTLRDPTGKYVMIDDPAFDPVFDYLEKYHIPVMGHLGEPKDCWLPKEEMTDPSDIVYYTNNPEYYMYLHPEEPGYDDQIRARDNLLRKHPHLDFTGAHLASLEWSVDELSHRLDSFPNLSVDLAARMFHLQYQSGKDREKVRDFMIRYQDRILYGTDDEVHDSPGAGYEKTIENLRRGWLAQWIYLATDSVTNVRGLQLPKEVIDKIYFKNAERFFGRSTANYPEN